MLAHIKATSWPLIASLGAIVISPLLLLTTGQGAFYFYSCPSHSDGSCSFFSGGSVKSL